MLLAYIDEVGKTGAFISPTHAKFNTSPAFEYAGFVLPATQARRFAAIFEREKRTLFSDEVCLAEHSGRWEKKGASIFRSATPERYPENLCVFDSLIRRLGRLGGKLFYYCDEKPLGTPRQTGLDTEFREAAAMRETLNRLARHADSLDSHLLVMINQINEKTRAQR